VPQSQDHGFGAAGYPQFGQDVADMRFDRGWADGQPSGDLHIVQSLDHQVENFTLALGQVQAGGWLAVSPRLCAASGESVARPAWAARMACTRSSAESTFSR
jgi:hypothetical protein